MHRTLRRAKGAGKVMRAALEGLGLAAPGMR